MPDTNWNTLRRGILTGDMGSLTDFINTWYDRGGSEEELAQLMALRNSMFGMQHQEQQQGLQPMRMQLLQGMAEQLGQQGFNPYASTPSALPNLPGIEGGGSVGSTPTGPRPGLNLPDFSDLSTRLSDLFGSEGQPPPPGGGGQPPPGGPTPQPDPDENLDNEPDPCEGLTGEALERCRQRYAGGET